MISMGALGRMIGRDLWPLLRSVRSRGMLRGALRYRRFATFSSGAVLVDVGAPFLPAAFVSAAFGVEVAGWFALMQHVIFMTIGLVAHGVAQAFVGRAARVGREAAPVLRRLFLRAAGRAWANSGVPASV